MILVGTMKQRIVVVTGATGALGSAIVERFERAGDKVIGVARSVPEGRGWIAADLTKPSETRGALRRAFEYEGKLEVLVHVLGGFEGGKPVADTEDGVWDRMMAMNASAAFYAIREAIACMKGQGGRIVAIGSRASVQNPATLAAYNASKAALNSLVQTAAAEGREDGITANVILPSTIDTEVNRKWGKPEDIDKWVKPAAIADLCFYLVSDAAKDISGALVPIYGRA